MKYDIAIVGAGPAGLSFARGLAPTGLSIVLLEKQPLTALQNPAYDGREIALTHLSHKIMQERGMWELIAPQSISLIKHARVLNGNSLYSLDFDFEDTGEPNLGFMVSNHLIRKAAYESLAGFENVTILTDTEVLHAETSAKNAVVTLDDRRVLEAALLVAADSRFSSVRDMLGVTADRLDFDRVCIVCKLSHETPENDTAYECFQYDRTLAILPLNHHEVSVVMTLDSAQSEGVLAMSPEDFAADVERRAGGRFQGLKLVTKLYPYPLIATFAREFSGARFALLGDAAVGMHPVTAHGFNLGLRGGYTLAEELKKTVELGGDLGSQIPLARYARDHKRVCAPLYHGTNTLVRLYTKTNPLAKAARHVLLRLGNRITPARRLILDQLTEI